MEFKGLTLDKFQEDAIHAINANKSVVVSAPTGSGKTLIADYIIARDVEKGVKVIYTAPIKALSNQKYKDFCKDYGEDKIGLMTGDIVINPTAQILIMTTEIYRNMVLLKDDMLEDISYVIFDEIHYINDVERGYIWEESIIFSRLKTRFLCLSATIPNADEFADWIQSIKRHKVIVVKHDKRNVPLHMNFYDAELGVTTLKKINEVYDIPEMKRIRGRKRFVRRRTPAPKHIDLVREIKNKVPCFFFTFSRARCQQFAEELRKKNIFGHDPEVSKIVSQKLRGVSPEIGNLKSTRILRETLPYGIGFHHAGLIPVIKELVEDLFSEGKIKVLYTTETFAVGINMPAKTVCFESLRKFDGINFRFLNSKEYFQIAGRAGRRGIDKEGHVYSMIDRRDFDYKLLKKITSADKEPIKSQFRLSINTVLNMVDQHDKKEIDKILCRNFHAFQKHGKRYDEIRHGIIFRQFAKMKKTLEKLGYLNNNVLTDKGQFTKKIYADELVIGEVFGTDFYKGLDEYQLLLILCAICYEPRERTEIYKVFPSKRLKELFKKLDSSKYLSREKKFRSLKLMTGFVELIYDGKTFFEIMKNTNLLEGDIIRFLRQALDRIAQIKKSAEDEELRQKIQNCQELIDRSMEDIEII